MVPAWLEHAHSLPISKVALGSAHPQWSSQLIIAQDWTVPPPCGQDTALGRAVPRSQLCGQSSRFCFQ